jgi:hypothetical protein
MQEVGFELMPDERMARDTKWSYLTSRTSCSYVFNIEYKLYIYIPFYKIKNIIVSGRVSTTGRGYSPSTARRCWLLQALGRFWDHIGAMDSMMFEVAELDGATMICHTNSKMKCYLLVLNFSNWYEVA